jgi:TPR repeat protein
LKTAAEGSLKMVDDPAFGQFRLGDRVIGKDRIVTFADLSRLTFVAAAGTEGQVARARFAGVDRTEDSIEIAVTAEVDDCDRLGGDRLNPQGVTSGVFASRIALASALSACESAVKRRPDVGRFVYQLARVNAALGRNAEADAGFRKAVELGHIRAQWALGYRALYLPPLKEREGLEWLTKAAALGDVYAQHTLGQAYYEGRGVPKDWERARKLFEKAAEGGQELSMDALGRMHQRGETVAINRALARRFWEEAAARGDIYGLDNLGYVYLEGIGAPQDFARARDYFLKASELGHPEAPNNIGRLYVNGLGVARDVAEAQRWYLIGMNRGDGWAAFNLGELARLGVGAPPDPALAAYYYARAAAASNRPEPASLGREALATQSEEIKMAGLRRLVAELDPAGTAARPESLPELAATAVAAQGVTPATLGLTDLMIASGQAILLAKGVRADLF